jgi:HEPN domain-containing protein
MATRLVNQWFKKSFENLRLAKLILNLDEKFYEHVCFNAQQCVEKAIKGYLNHNKVRFDKTHDIGVLVSLVRSVEPELAAQLKSADELTKFAVRIRYPEEAGDALVIDKKLAEHTIQIAESVYLKLIRILD